MLTALLGSFTTGLNASAGPPIAVNEEPLAYGRHLSLRAYLAKPTVPAKPMTSYGNESGAFTYLLNNTR